MRQSSVITPERFATFGELLRFLRRKANLTQRELSIAVGYSVSQISRLEQDERAPEEAMLAARFLPALYIDDEPQWAARLLELGVATRSHTPQAETPQPIAEVKPIPHNLPIQLTSFIGREKEISEIKRLLAGKKGESEGSVRLLTLTGHGGCGKTRLALQCAFGLLDDFRDGVWLIELAVLTDSALVPQVVATVLGLKEEAGRTPFSTLIDHLRGKSILLVLDNCEHLIQAIAQLAEALLHTCPDVHILATSRETLGVAGERALVVPSLSIPDLHTFPLVGADLVSALSQYESVRLFTERAVIVMPGFMLTEENSIAVAQICQRLDGIPLALELAAALIKVLRAEQIAARLADSFRLLTGGTRTALPRQQTLQATMDWSYELLTKAEQRLFNRLSVFAGGWTLEAVEIVCAGDGIASAHVLNILVQLVNKSLVVAERVLGKETRYRLLEIVRQYSLAKLAANGEVDAIQKRHVEYYLMLAEVGETLTDITSELAWRARMETEYHNLRTALAWSQSDQVSAELGLRLVCALGWFWAMIGSYWSEGRGWLERALAHINTDAEQVANKQKHAKILYDLAFICTSQSDFSAGEVHFADSLKLYQELGEVSTIAEVLERLGWLARERGDFPTARLRLEESQATYRKLGYKNNTTQNTLGEVLVMQEDTEGAARLLEESLTLSRELGDQNGIGWALNHLGHVAQLRGDYERATQLHLESLPFFRNSEPQWLGIPHVHQSLGETALAQGNVALAASHLMKALGLFHEFGEQMCVSWCLSGLAGVAALDEEPERAAWLWGASEALRQSIGTREAPASRLTRERLQAEVRKQLGEDVFKAKWAEGQSASMERAIAEATL